MEYIRTSSSLRNEEALEQKKKEELLYYTQKNQIDETSLEPQQSSGQDTGCETKEIKKKKQQQQQYKYETPLKSKSKLQKRISFMEEEEDEDEDEELLVEPAIVSPYPPEVSPLPAPPAPLNNDYSNHKTPVVKNKKQLLNRKKSNDTANTGDSSNAPPVRYINMTKQSSQSSLVSAATWDYDNDDDSCVSSIHMELDDDEEELKEQQQRRVERKKKQQQVDLVPKGKKGVVVNDDESSLGSLKSTKSDLSSWNSIAGLASINSLSVESIVTSLLKGGAPIPDDDSKVSRSSSLLVEVEDEDNRSINSRRSRRSIASKSSQYSCRSRRSCGSNNSKTSKSSINKPGIMVVSSLQIVRLVRILTSRQKNMMGIPLRYRKGNALARRMSDVFTFPDPSSEKGEEKKGSPVWLWQALLDALLKGGSEACDIYIGPPKNDNGKETLIQMPLLMWLCQWKKLEVMYAWKGRDDVVSLLLAAGADPNICWKDPNNKKNTKSTKATAALDLETPMFATIQYGCIGTIKTLMKFGAATSTTKTKQSNSFVRDSMGRSYLWHALERPQPTMIRFLLQHQLVDANELFPTTVADDAQQSMMTGIDYLFAAQLSLALYFDKKQHTFQSSKSISVNQAEAFKDHPVSWQLLGPPNENDIASSMMELYAKQHSKGSMMITPNEMNISLLSFVLARGCTYSNKTKRRKYPRLQRMAYFMIGKWLPKEDEGEVSSESELQAKQQQEEQYSLYNHYHQIQQQKNGRRRQSSSRKSLTCAETNKDDNICRICNESMMLEDDNDTRDNDHNDDYSYYRPTVELYCGHEFCLGCILGYGNGSINHDLTCPTCHSPLCLDLTSDKNRTECLTKTYGTEYNGRYAGPTAMSLQQLELECQVRGLLSSNTGETSKTMTTTTMRGRLLNKLPSIRRSTSITDTKTTPPAAATNATTITTDPNERKRYLQSLLADNINQTQIYDEKERFDLNTNVVIKNTSPESSKVQLIRPIVGQYLIAIPIRVKSVPIIAYLSLTSEVTIVSSKFIDEFKLNTIEQQQCCSKENLKSVLGNTIPQDTQFTMVDSLEIELVSTTSTTTICLNNALSIDDNEEIGGSLPNFMGIQLGLDFLRSGAWCIIDTPLEIIPDDNHHFQPKTPNKKPKKENNPLCFVSIDGYGHVSCHPTDKTSIAEKEAAEATAGLFSKGRQLFARSSNDTTPKKKTNENKEELRYYALDGTVIRTPLLRLQPFSSSFTSITTNNWMSIDFSSEENECHWCCRKFPNMSTCIPVNNNSLYCTKACRIAAKQIQL